MRIENLEEERVDIYANVQTKCTNMTDDENVSIRNCIDGATSNVMMMCVRSSPPLEQTQNAPLSAENLIKDKILTRKNNYNNLRTGNDKDRGKSQSQECKQKSDSSSSDGGAAAASGVGVVGGGAGGEAGAIVGGGAGGSSNTNDGGVSEATRGNNVSESPSYSTYGGRLQFFKDGKFILELARSREGEKSGWISVPRKTFWPPSASITNVVNFSKNESSTSLSCKYNRSLDHVFTQKDLDQISVSDDNSSIQSSPWQRDHCWKQSSPRRNISKEMNLFYKRNRLLKFSCDGLKCVQIKKRRPYDNSTICQKPFSPIIDKNQIKTEESKSSSTSNSTSTTTPIESESVAKIKTDPTSIKIKTEPDEEPEKIEVKLEETATVNNRSTLDKKEIKVERCPRRSRSTLSSIVQKLIDRIPPNATSTSSSNQSKIVNSCLNQIPAAPARLTELQYHQQHVSPRKRILRELEKVSLEDNSNKRSRAKSHNSNTLSPLSTNSTQFPPTGTVSSTNQHHRTSSSSPLSSSSASAKNNQQQQVINGTDSRGANELCPPTTPQTRLYSSYSIHSLLSNATNNNNSNNNDTKPTMKDINEAAYLKNRLVSPNSPENYSRVGSSPNSAFTSSAAAKNFYKYEKSPSKETFMKGYSGTNATTRSDEQNYSKIKSSSSIPISTAASSGFHPYLLSTKHSPGSIGSSPGSTYKPNYSPGLSNHQPKNYSSNSGSSPSYSRTSPLVNKAIGRAGKNLNLKETSPNDEQQHHTILDVRGRNSGSAASIQQPQKLSPLTPISSPNTKSMESASPSTYYDDHKPLRGLDGNSYLPSTTTSIVDIKAERTNDNDSTSTASPVLRSSPVVPPSSLYYMYPPPPGLPGSPHAAASSYIPTVPYYHSMSPYAAAVAALRNPLWMHYPPSPLQSAGPATPRRTSSSSSTSTLAYNSVNSGVSSIASAVVPPAISPSHLPLGLKAPWGNPNQHISTEDLDRIYNIKSEHSSDVPLNLSKH